MDASRVIEKFGGQSALARMIGKGPSTVQYWAKSGSIPAKWHTTLLQLATARSVDLTPRDLVELPPTEIVLALPEARWFGTLMVSDEGLPCYVLDDGRRLVSRTGATNLLSGKNHGKLGNYTGVLSEYLPANFQDQLIEFRIEGVNNKTVRGMTADTLLDICTAYVHAREADGLTQRQREIAAQAARFLAACAKVGLIALIDEVTGYQYDRAQDALQVKLRAFLEDEMRKWGEDLPGSALA